MSWNDQSSSHHHIIIPVSRRREICPFLLRASLEVADNVAVQTPFVKLSHMAMLSAKEAGKYNPALHWNCGELTVEEEEGENNYCFARAHTGPRLSLPCT